MKLNTIAGKNDVFRSSFIGGQVVLTQGVAALEQNVQSQVVEAVQKFKTFEPGNDPYGEHDFGKVVVAGVDYFWKIDIYPEEKRVLTIMLASEY